MFIHLILQLIPLMCKRLNLHLMMISDDDMPSATEFFFLPASAPAPAPRRSERIKRKPGPLVNCHFSNSSPTPDVPLLGTCCDSPSEVALLTPEIPNTYDEAMSPGSKYTPSCVSCKACIIPYHYVKGTQNMGIVYDTQ